MKKIVFVILAFMLAACSIGQKSELSKNQTKWENAHIASYRFSLFIGCFCAFRDQMPLTIEVHDGKVTSMAYADGSPVSADDSQLEYFHRFATVEALFAEVQADQNGRADEIKTEYDSKYGYPTQIRVDQIKEAVDDEYSLTVSNFEVLE